MIKSFKCADTAAIFDNKSAPRFAQIRSVAQRKLRVLDAAQQIIDLRAPPGNRLEMLQGNRKGQYSIRINDQWRLCFQFIDHNAYDVEIVDYH